MDDSTSNTAEAAAAAAERTRWRRPVAAPRRSRTIFAATGAALASLADLLLLETASDLHELLLGVDEARSLSDLPILTSMTFGEEAVAIDGTSPAAAARRIRMRARTGPAMVITA